MSLVYVVNVEVCLYGYFFSKEFLEYVSDGDDFKDVFDENSFEVLIDCYFEWSVAEVVVVVWY